MDFKKGGSTIKGVGKVVIGKDSFSITLQNVKFMEKGRQKTGDKKLTFDMDALDGILPDGCPLSAKVSYYIATNADGTEIYQFRPAKMVLPVKFSGWAKDADGNTKLFEGTNTFTNKEQVQAVAELKVASGKYKGIIYPLYLPVNIDGTDVFTEDQNGKFYINTGSTKIQNLLEFTGMVELDPDFPSGEDLEGVLLFLESKMLKAKKVFAVSIEKGYPKELSEWEEGGDEDDTEESSDIEEDDDEEEAAPAPKKLPTKKTGRKFDE